MEPNGKQYRDELVKIVRENVQVCQNKFGGKTLLATETEQAVLKVLNGLELILQNGLKARNTVNLKNITLSVNSFSFRYFKFRIIFY